MKEKVTMCEDCGLDVWAALVTVEVGKKYLCEECWEGWRWKRDHKR